MDKLGGWSFLIFSRRAAPLRADDSNSVTHVISKSLSSLTGMRTFYSVPHWLWGLIIIFKLCKTALDSSALMRARSCFTSFLAGYLGHKLLNPNLIIKFLPSYGHWFCWTVLRCSSLSFAFVNTSALFSPMPVESLLIPVTFLIIFYVLALSFSVACTSNDMSELLSWLDHTLLPLVLFIDYHGSPYV